jgi:2-polyprenyl-3-methyl-5-hydroxy-6-metoxy-1,4-benzoquinol methylase
MDYFVKPIDSLSRLINDKAAKLYELWNGLSLEKINIPETAVAYFMACHGERTFFSVQTAAELLYRSISQKGKAVEELTIMDYGAGIGSLYLLAKMIGCKTVIYNDIIDDMKVGGKAIADYLNIPIDVYIAADHTKTIEILNQKGISCDIILSRNVVEHIYDLDDFYGKMAVGQPNALIYFSTTANYHNPAMLMFHHRLHKRYEKKYAPKRAQIISAAIKDIAPDALTAMVSATKGLAVKELDNAIDNFKKSKTLPNPGIHGTNTCDPENGMWAEHIIPKEEYQRIIESKGYKFTIKPAFWDTHYNSVVKNIFGKTMNTVSNALGNKHGLKTTAFIYVIAEKK